MNHLLEPEIYVDYLFEVSYFKLLSGYKFNFSFIIKLLFVGTSDKPF